MSDLVILEDEVSNQREKSFSKEPTGIIVWMLKNKLVQNQKQAEQLLIGIAFTSLLITLMILFFTFFQMPNASINIPVGQPITS